MALGRLSAPWLVQRSQAYQPRLVVVVVKRLGAIFCGATLSSQNNALGSKSFNVSKQPTAVTGTQHYTVRSTKELLCCRNECGRWFNWAIKADVVVDTVENGEAEA